MKLECRFDELEPELSEGVPVLIEGLERAPHLNGACGAIMGKQKPNGRWPVQIGDRVFGIR